MSHDRQVEISLGYFMNGCRRLWFLASHHHNICYDNAWIFRFHESLFDLSWFLIMSRSSTPGESLFIQKGTEVTLWLYTSSAATLRIQMSPQKFAFALIVANQIEDKESVHKGWWYIALLHFRYSFATTLDWPHRQVLAVYNGSPRVDGMSLGCKIHTTLGYYPWWDVRFWCCRW